MPERLLRRLPLLGLLLGMLFWVLDSVVDAFVFGEYASFLQALVDPGASELWMRACVMVLLLSFSWYARRQGIRLEQSQNLLEASEAELDTHRDMQVVLRRQADELNRRVVRVESEQERLRLLAYQDPLTGLYNRRRIEEILESARLTQQLSEAGLGVLLVDIDHFKKVNDRFGHFAGDRVLSEMSTMLKTYFRRGDAAGRWGGEEFLVILPNLSVGEAEVVSENFRLRVARAEFPPAGKLTVSLGLAMIEPGETAESVLKRADKALMMAKNNGRNRLYLCQCRNGLSGACQEDACVPFGMTSVIA